MLNCGSRQLDTRITQVMGVLNITPDSFSDGGQFADFSNAIDHAQAMVEAGAAIIDIGGESTRPGAEPVSVQQELDRVIPVIEALTGRVDAILSVDTSTPEVMRAAAAAGAHMLNDVRALSRPGATEAALEVGLPVCLMHMQGQPGTMQQNPNYENVVAEVKRYLLERIRHCEQSGLSRQQLLIDPGFGFGKTLRHNLALLQHLDAFLDSGCPLLVGMSRKSMIGDILNKPLDQRLHGSVSAAVIAALKGAAIVRVHDVAETVDAICVANAVKQAE
jgi:dihydropteroate synthase